MQVIWKIRSGIIYRRYVFYYLCLLSVGVQSQELQGEMFVDTIYSEILEENQIGLNPLRKVVVYLPPGYHDSDREFPVVFYLHNIFNEAAGELEHFDFLEMSELAFERGMVPEFILVAGDFTGPTTGSWFENSTTSGRWRDHIVDELVPYVESKFRTINEPISRACVGYFAGGRGALQLAMLYPQVFGVAYAMHPVATGTGYLPLKHVDVDWSKIHDAASYQEIAHLGRTPIFLSICQAFLPNHQRPPFYCDFLFEKKGGELFLVPENVKKERTLFHLDEWLDANDHKLRQIKGIAFDWARFDVTQAHVISNRRYSKLLTDLGVPHEGEEFAGEPWSSYGTEKGRVLNRVLPFLGKYFEN